MQNGDLSFLDFILLQTEIFQGWVLLYFIVSLVGPFFQVEILIVEVSSISETDDLGIIRRYFGAHGFIIRVGVGWGFGFGTEEIFDPLKKAFLHNNI